MKTCLLSFFSIAIFLLVFSCQREIFFDIVSEGVLIKDISNDCEVATKGNYIVDKKLDGSNNVKVKVHVTAKGSYSITTDTVNGYSFYAAGNFKDTGIVLVTLKGYGKPLVNGSDLFTIIYGDSNCHFLNKVSSGTNASFILQGAPNSCMIDTVSGAYVKGLSLDTTNEIAIVVDVSNPGFYEISTDTVNGYYFYASGTFSTSGAQMITLKGFGKPIHEGADEFTVKAGGSSCNFSNTVITTVTVSNNDHFPLTMSSYWDYTDLYYQGNIVTTIVIGENNKNGNVYKTVEEEISPGGPIILYYRKSGSDYYEYAAADKYTASFQYAKKIYDDLPFLKEGLSNNAQWHSKEYSDTASFGQIISLQYDYTCLNANATIAINGHAFANVYIIEMKPKIKGASNTYAYTGEKYTYYYAKGIGLIYYKKENLGTTNAELRLKDWQVN